MKRVSIVIIILLLCVRYYFFTQFQGDPEFIPLVGSKVELEGIVVEEPAAKQNSTQLVIKIHSTKILVIADAYADIQYGDQIKISGKLVKPENFASDNGRTFDYISYLAKDRIFYKVPFAQVARVSQNHGDVFKSFILTIKNGFIRSLEKSLPFTESRLAAGLVVAGKQALPKAVQDEFVKTGTVQVVVLSGYNVTIVAETIMSLLSFLPNTAGLSLGAGSIILFAIAAGGSATIVRATIMVMIALLGKFTRQKYNVGRALITSAVLMLFANPMLLFFDPSFQLSFLATFGLIYFSPLIEKYFEFVPEAWHIRQALIATVATQLFVTPFILYLTGNVSLVAIPANLALFLITPITMLLSFMTGVLGICGTLIGWPMSVIAFLFLHLMLLIVHFFSVLPFASFSISSFPLWLVALCYLGYSVLMFRFYRRSTSHS